MNCPKCNHENPGGAKFCSNCATQLCQVCPSCNATNIPIEAKFCPNCGSVITQVQNMQPTYLFGPTGKWDEYRNALLVDIDQVKIIHTKGYKIQSELTFEPDRDVDDYIAFLSDDGKFEFYFSAGKLMYIFYFYNSKKRDKIGLSITPYDYVGRKWLKSYQHNEWKPDMVSCSDNEGNSMDEDDWFETYGKIFYSDLEPYRKNLIDFFGFDLFKEGFWLES